VQIEKFVWAVSSCESHPTVELFAKYYELHYQQKITLKGIKNKLAKNFGCITFHPNRYGNRANEAHPRCDKQMVKRLVEELVLLQGALTESRCLWKGDVSVEVRDEPVGLFD
jgi:hypothetical protein